MLFPVFNIAGMMLDNFTSESVPVDMCIDFSGGDGFMSQHILYRSQVCSSTHQMRSKRMTEHFISQALTVQEHRRRCFLESITEQALRVKKPLLTVLLLQVAHPTLQPFKAKDCAVLPS